MQSINTALGGTLIQDIPSMLNLCHSNCGATECMHEIKISARSKLKEALGLRAIVNSYHHQCVHLTGSGLTVAAASHDGVIEAIEGTELPLLGTQWHPERMAGNAVFDHFFRHISVRIKVNIRLGFAKPDILFYRFNYGTGSVYRGVLGFLQSICRAAHLHKHSIVRDMRVKPVAPKIYRTRQRAVALAHRT